MPLYYEARRPKRRIQSDMTTTDSDRPQHHLQESPEKALDGSVET
jgi:hypothetical protein